MQRVFPHTANQKPEHASKEGLRKGQATRFLVHRPAQRSATHWGQYTAAPNAMKTTHFNQSFAVFPTLPTRYDAEKKHARLRQGR